MQLGKKKKKPRKDNTQAPHNQTNPPKGMQNIFIKSFTFGEGLKAFEVKELEHN